MRFIYGLIYLSSTITFALLLVLLTQTGSIHAFCYEEAGKTYDINPQLLRAIAVTETNENPDALNYNKNGTVDIGLMQINSFWIPIANLDKNALLSDPCYNVMVGARILRYCIDLYGYTWEAIGCYNAKSSSKKVSYSWKIYRALNKLKLKGMNSTGVPKNSGNFGGKTNESD